MKNNLFLIGVLMAALVLSSAIAMTASDRFGDETNEFTTATPVYLTHPVTVFCNTELADAQLNVYIVEDKEWENNDEIRGVIVNTTVSTNSRGKLVTTMIWESPEVGDYDIIIDLDKNGKYNYGDSCSDLVDDDSVAGFTVTQAEKESEAPEDNEDVAAEEHDGTNNIVDKELSEDETGTVAAASTADKDAGNEHITANADGKTDYIPFIIIAVAIVIAGLIIAVTLMRMH